MQRDKNGTLLSVGDEVLLRCRVTAVFDDEEFCNVDLEPITDAQAWQSYSGNSRQCEIVPPKPEGEMTDAEFQELSGFFRSPEPVR